MRRVVAMLLCAAAAFGMQLAHARPVAEPLAIPAPPKTALTQSLGAQLPLALPFVDSDGQDVRFGDYFAPPRPVLLVFGYYSCPQLCGLLMHGLLEALHESGLGPRDVRIVGVSIDPADSPASARSRLAADMAYASFVRGHARDPLPDLHLLTGDVRPLARSAGFEWSGKKSTLAHPAGVIVATPDGRVSRYLPGVRFDSRELRDAVDEARQGTIGTFTDRLALLCAHFDPRTGRYSDDVMTALRIFGVALALLLASWCWRRRGAPRDAREAR
jgi:protein SCO1/2